MSDSRMSNSEMNMVRALQVDDVVASRYMVKEKHCLRFQRVSALVGDSSKDLGLYKVCLANAAHPSRRGSLKNGNTFRHFYLVPKDKVESIVMNSSAEEQLAWYGAVRRAAEIIEEEEGFGRASTKTPLHTLGRRIDSLRDDTANDIDELRSELEDAVTELRAENDKLRQELELLKNAFKSRSRLPVNGLSIPRSNLPTEETT